MKEDEDVLLAAQLLLSSRLQKGSCLNQSISWPNQFNPSH